MQLNAFDLEPKKHAGLSDPKLRLYKTDCNSKIKPSGAKPWSGLGSDTDTEHTTLHAWRSGNNSSKTAYKLILRLNLKQPQDNSQKYLKLHWLQKNCLKEVLHFSFKLGSWS